MKASKVVLAVAISTICLAAMATQKPAQEPASEKKEPASQETAIRSAVDEFVKAFNEGNATALVASFTEDAEIRTLDEESIMGRDAILDHFTNSFADNPGAKIQIEVLSIRLLAPDAALEEGRAVVTSDGEESPETTLYEAIHVLKEGKWLQARVRDFSDADPEPHDRLKPLEWLLGDWVDEGADGIVHSSCKWSDDGQFLLRDFHMSIQGHRERTVNQRIGWDPISQQIKGWSFDTSGGHSEQYWSQSSPERWVIKSEGVTPDGRRASSTNILARTGKDSVTWTSTDRTLGGEALEDNEEITMVRRPPVPK